MASDGGSSNLPPGIPPGAKEVDLNNLPPEIANDAALMQQLQQSGVKKFSKTPEGSEKGRHAFTHNGNTVYEWEQDLEEVNVWIKPPPGVTTQHLDIKISHGHVRVGIKGNPPFLDEDTGGEIVLAESFWSFQDGEITINFQKMRKGQTWMSALKGHGQLDPLAQQEDQKRLMLERFAQENPGFDFSNASFNGQVPDARSFMGGVKYN